MLYERLTKRCDDILHVFDINDHEIALNELKPLDITMIVGRLTFLEDKIESGELVDRNEYLMAAKNTSELTDKEIEFFVKHNARVRKNAEIARLTTENAELRERLEKAVELPYVKRDCELTQIVYRNNYGNIEEETYFHDCYYGQGHDVRGDVYVEARLEELKGGKE